MTIIKLKFMILVLKYIRSTDNIRGTYLEDQCDTLIKEIEYKKEEC